MDSRFRRPLRNPSFPLSRESKNWPYQVSEEWSNVPLALHLEVMQRSPFAGMTILVFAVLPRGDHRHGVGTGMGERDGPLQESERLCPCRSATVQGNGRLAAVIGHDFHITPG